MAPTDLSIQAAYGSKPSRESTTAKPSTLLSLPAELRNIIWAHVLGGRTFDIACEIRIPWGTTTTNTTVEKHSLALLQTSRQTYSETRLLPFRLNAFHFKSEDAFKPWLSKFDAAQQAAMTEVRLVTWKAKHMVQSRGFAPRRLGDVFPVERFAGLRRICVEVRYTGVVRECEKWACEGSELEDGDCTEQEGRLRLKWAKCDPRLVVKFERVAV